MRNATGNSIAERINNTINSSIRCMQHLRLPEVETRLNFLLQNSFHRILGYSPNEIRYKYSWFYPLKRIIDVNFEAIKTCIKRANIENLEKMNKDRKNYNYSIDD